MTRNGQDAIGEPGSYLSYGDFNGIQGISPSVAVEFDTWNNGFEFDDIFNDHAMLHYNGVMDGSAGPAIDLGNIEDGQYYLVEAIWDAVDQQFTVTFDGMVIIDENVDLINDVFGGNPEVLVGFTGSTGGSANIQVVCDIQVIYIEECNGLDDDCDGLIDEDTEQFVEQAFTICDGDSIVVGNSVYTASGNYEDTLSSVLGCDSIVTTNLIVNPTFDVMNVVAICDGQEYQVGTNTYTESGTYLDFFQASTGCDSIVETVLNVLPLAETFVEASICAGESYALGDDVYTESGEYTEVFVANASCDSTVFLSLEVLEVFEQDQFIEICSNESLLTAMGEYSVAGEYEEVYTSSNGCDSIVRFDIEVKPISSSEQQRFICSGGQFVIGTSSHTEEGIYVDTLTSMNGCDSVVTTTLGVIDELVIPDSTLCDGDRFELDMNPFPFHDIQGDFSESGGIYAFTQPGIGSVLVDLDGCVLEDGFELRFLPVYDNVSTDIELCDEELVTLRGRDLNIAYSWDNGEQEATIQVPEPGVYTKRYEYSCGDFEDRFIVEGRACDCFVYIPNAFSPDGDLVNDFFAPEFSCEFLEYELVIYDRYGQVLFESSDPTQPWNGGGVSGYYAESGVYQYLLSYKAQGREGLLEKKQHGVVTVVR